MFLEHEGTATKGRTSSIEGENDINALYTNEEEKELYTFLSNNNLNILYDKLKYLELYVPHLQSINLDLEFDDLCTHSLELSNKFHLKLRLKTALRSLQQDLISNIAPAARDNPIQSNLSNPKLPPLPPLPHGSRGGPIIK